MSILYFDVEYAQKVHNEVIRLSGGREGTHNIGMVETVLNFIKNDTYYPTFEEKLTHLVFAINKNHAFIDGNKRTSLALGEEFLEINGYGYCAKIFVQKMENIAVSIADNLISKDLLQKIITSLIYEAEYSEELKLEIFIALSSKEILE
ncbi:MAG: hypothetical protein RL154_811 [Pseudomonadota bacterium]|jgi:death-on-curing protein